MNLTPPRSPLQPFGRDAACAGFLNPSLRNRTRFDYSRAMPTNELIKRITIDSRVCHGKRCIRGLLYPVSMLLELIRTRSKNKQLGSADEYETISGRRNGKRRSTKVVPDFSKEQRGRIGSGSSTGVLPADYAHFNGANLRNLRAKQSLVFEHLANSLVRSRHIATSRDRVEIYSRCLSAKRARFLFITSCRLKSETTFAARPVVSLWPIGSQTGEVSSVPRGFGVRGLDPAFTFGGRSFLRWTMAKRDWASHIFSKLDAQTRGKKSGVKPPHSKASRHSHAARVGNIVRSSAFRRFPARVSRGRSRLKAELQTRSR